jgi:hypothetical protein
MEKFKEIRVFIPVDLHEKLKKYLKKEYKKPTEFVKSSIVEYVLEKERNE